MSTSERGHAATLVSISQLLSQTLGITMSALLLAGAQAARDVPALTVADFRIALCGVCVIGFASLLPFLRLSATTGHEVIGGARPGA